MNTPTNPAPSAADNAPTPRTYASLKSRNHLPNWFDDVVAADFARTLERELTSAQAALAAKDREIARLSEQVRDLDALRLCHGIELSSDPAPVGEDAACAEIHRLWRDEHCMAARGVLVRYSVTHDNLNRTMAILMVRAANQALQKERERADKLVRETENLRCKVLDQQDALNNLPDPAGVVALQARAEKAEAELARCNDLCSNEHGGTVSQSLAATITQLRAEVEHIKAWANAKADEAQDLRATLLAREGELDELQRQLAEAGKDRERLETVIRWALGEVEDFPTWPDSVTIKGNPKFWWRTELRKRFDTARAGEGRP